jgi:hypothetical protein
MTPLLDFFRRGEVAHDVKLLAAQGALAPRASEQLALLVLLTSDADPDIARTAETTIASIPRESLAAFLARSDAPAALRSFFALRGVVPAAVAAPAADEPLVDVDVPPASLAGAEADAAEEADDTNQSVLQRLAAMSVAQRLTRAMKGSREERSILIRDPNKLVSVAVLSSPKVSDAEVESFAKMANVSEEILRTIAGTRAWVKNYAVASALTRNPKTPVALSMNLLSRLTDRDLRQITTDRNVPDVLRLTAKKKLSEK